MGAQIVNLEGTQYISDVPSVYYGATSSLVSKIDPFAGNLMGKVTEKGTRKRGREKGEKGTGNFKFSFLTLHWIAILTRTEITNIVFDSLKFLQNLLNLELRNEEINFLK